MGEGRNWINIGRDKRVMIRKTLNFNSPLLPEFYRAYDGKVLAKLNLVCLLLLRGDVIFFFKENDQIQKFCGFKKGNVFCHKVGLCVYILCRYPRNQKLLCWCPLRNLTGSGKNC